MLRILRIFTIIMILFVITAPSSNALQGWFAPEEKYEIPEGKVFIANDGSFKYIVSEKDINGQWGIAFKIPALWEELRKKNLQLTDPDKIMAGQMLNLTPALAALMDQLSSMQMTEDALDRLKNLPPPEPIVIEISNEEGVPYWRVIVACIIISSLVALYTARLKDIAYEKKNALRRKEHNEHIFKESKKDPYSGRNQVDDGLLTTTSALKYLTKQYQKERSMMSVANSANMDDSVVIVSMKSIDIIGKMNINYADSVSPLEKDLTEWTPAWLCTLDNGSRRIALMFCGNDVSSGDRISVLYNDQIRDRKDFVEIKPNLQIWPMISEEEKAAALPKYYLRLKVDETFCVNETSLENSHINNLVALFIYKGSIMAQTKNNDKQIIGEVIYSDQVKPKDISINLSKKIALFIYDGKVMIQTKNGERHVMSEIIGDRSNNLKEVIKKDLDQITAETNSKNSDDKKIVQDLEEVNETLTSDEDDNTDSAIDAFMTPSNGKSNGSDTISKDNESNTEE